jgi:AAA15 family ATPase/GTPase
MNEKYAIAGIKHYINHKKKFIEGLSNQSQSWNEESKDIMAQLTKSIADHLTRDVEYFEHLLKLIEKKKKSKDSIKIREIYQLDPKIKAEIARQVQLQVNKALKKKHGDT